MDVVYSVKAEDIMLDTLSADIKILKEEFETVKAIAKTDGENFRGEDGKIVNLSLKKFLAELKEHTRFVSGRSTRLHFLSKNIYGYSVC